MAQGDPYERDRWRSGSNWGQERSYSSDRPYGDRGYGWRGDDRDAGSSGMSERDYNGTTRPTSEASGYAGIAPGRYEGPAWSSTEGWRNTGPHVGRGPRGYQRADDRIREEINDTTQRRTAGASAASGRSRTR